MCFPIQEGGFTLLETVLTLLYFLILISLSPVILQSFFQKSSPESTHPIEVELFYQELFLDVTMATNLQKHEKGFSFDTPTQERVSYEKYKELIRRLVLGQGHDVRLQRIQMIEIEENPHYLKVKVRGKEGETYERTFLRFLTPAE